MLKRGTGNHRKKSGEIKGACGEVAGETNPTWHWKGRKRNQYKSNTSVLRSSDWKVLLVLGEKRGPRHLTSSQNERQDQRCQGGGDSLKKTRRGKSNSLLGKGTVDRGTVREESKVQLGPVKPVAFKKGDAKEREATKTKRAEEKEKETM